MPKLLFKTIWNSLLLSLLFLGSCKKDAGVIDSRTGVTKINRFIPTDYSIQEFSVVDENLIFAMGVKYSQLKLFKTTDGGVNWSEMSIPAILDPNNMTLQSIVFFDADNGMIVVNNRAYRTYDGGQTWGGYIQLLPPPGSSYSYQFIFAGKLANGDFFLVESTGSWWAENRMFTSQPYALGYTQINSYTHDFTRFDYGHLCNGKFIYLVRDFNDWDNKLYVFDLATSLTDTLEIQGYIPRDAYYADGKYTLVRETGKINVYDSYAEEDYYNFHEEDYHSIERIDDYYVAVANKSITTNYSGQWKEVQGADGLGHAEFFRKVQKVENSKYFYISGDNGTFYKATFE